MATPLVGIVVGSESDLPIMREAATVLTALDIPHELTIASAHRAPDHTTAYAKSAAERGLKVLIAGAGYAAHLGGVLAAHTILPVIGVPIDSSPLRGIDALLATSQMPAGVPVAAVTIGAAGAKNAAYLAAQILALSEATLAKKLEAHRHHMATTIAAQDRALRTAR